MDKVDVVIPLYKPDNSFFDLIERLEHQSVPVNRIILMNTEEKYFERLIYGVPFLEKYHNVDVVHLSKKEFDHGRTRRQGVKRSDAPIFIMMTQDAMPTDEHLIERLTAPLKKKQVAVSYARQMANDKCHVIEGYTRTFNYPEKSSEKSLEDIGKLGIKTYFCSNVCAAYNREIYDSLGGFVKRTIFNEDMIYAAKAVKAGYKIAYAAEAAVVHSHNYTCSQQFHRNFDLGVSQAEHPEVFADVPSEGEGIKMVKQTTEYLWKSGSKRFIPVLYMQSFCKYAGFVLGKRYKKLPKRWVLWCTANKEYWKRNTSF